MSLRLSDIRNPNVYKVQLFLRILEKHEIPYEFIKDKKRVIIKPTGKVWTFKRIRNWIDEYYQ